MYYLENVLKHEGESIQGKTIACAGFGNVTWGICKKAAELGAKVVTLSGPDGYIYDPDGVTTSEKVAYLLEMRASGRNVVKDYADKFGVEFYPGEKPWGVKVDICMPSAMQNDVYLEHAKKIAQAGVKYYIEVANMPTTNDALRYLMDCGLIVAPSKAVNAGGVATSALEMAQNSERMVWTAQEVDKQLRQIMNTIYTMSVEAAEEYGLGYNLVAGANIAGFMKVADAMSERPSWNGPSIKTIIKKWRKKDDNSGICGERPEGRRSDQGLRPGADRQTGVRGGEDHLSACC